MGSKVNLWNWYSQHPIRSFTSKG